MLKNYLATAWRNLVKNKFYSFLLIGGLTIGLAVGMLILLWVRDEWSYDSFHRKADNLCRLELFGGTGSSKMIWQATVAPIGPLSKQELPEVKDQVRITRDDIFSLYKYADKSFGDEEVVFADPSLFSVFDFPLVEGNTSQPFKDDNSVVITRRTAAKFFGSTNPMGKVITADNKVNFTVTGVIGDLPSNSSLQFDMVMPFGYHAASVRQAGGDIGNDFNHYGYMTFLLLRPGASCESLSDRIRRIHLAHKPEDTDAEYLLLPLKKMHLYNADGTDRGIGTVRIFFTIALLILSIGCINYVNLSTARAILRSKEISMRKIIGASRHHLFLQFIIETALLFFFAAFLAVGLAHILMPLFNDISGKEMVFDMTDPHIWQVVLLTTMGTLLASSIYPALLLSSFRPLQALRGKISTRIGSVLFRRVLVITQFGFSIILIIGTIIITTQMRYIRSRQLGYDKTYVFSCWMRDMGAHYEAIRTELLKQPGIAGVTRASSNIVSMGGISGDNDWDGKAPGQTFIVHPMAVDKDFLPFFHMQLAAGKGFSGSINDTSCILLNETAVREAGIKDPIGKRFRMWRTRGTIIGVVKDFHFASMKERIAPAVFYANPENLSRIYVRTTAKDAAMAIRAVQKQFRQYNGEYPFSYAFLDDTFNKLYQGETREGVLFNCFSLIAIFISCMGLLGLSAYTAQVRTREIGVRKVLGAGVGNITLMLSADYIRLVLIAFVIAAPVAGYVSSRWLQDFAYRITISWWVFPLAGSLAVLIAFLTIGFQTVRAAMTNPVRSLRTD